MWMLPALLLISAQQPTQDILIRRPPTFATEIEVINVNVTVADTENRFVTRLSERDFAIFEDGVPQRPAFFWREDLPLSLSVLIDCSASMDETLSVAQEAGVRFVRTLRPGDRAQVVQFSDRVATLQDFTADQVALENAIRSTSAAGPTALHTALYVTLKQLRAEGSRSEPRRRSVVLLSDGEDTASPVTDDQVLELARRSEIAVHAVSLTPKRSPDRAMARNQAVHFLTVLARDTGGQIYSVASALELDGVYSRISAELRSQYTLGYVPTNLRRDGKWRRIVVRMRDEALRVRHKLGYYAPRN